MNVYTPSSWVVVKMYPVNVNPLYRLLGGWSGGYLDGDSWRLNSGITDVSDSDLYYTFTGSSGSEYRVNKSGYGLSISTVDVWAAFVCQLGDKVQMMPEDTDWLKLDWSTTT